MRKDKFCYRQVRAMDMVDYLATLGHQPRKVSNQDYWYLSPFRNEKEPSFKINRKLNVWYDHGIGKGGNLIEFGKLFHQCSSREFLIRMEEKGGFGFSMQTGYQIRKPMATRPAEEKILITDCRPIIDLNLRRYLNHRNIPLEIANDFCSQIEFTLYGKKHTVIGFKNELGGFELRNKYFKGSSHPKAITWIKNNPAVISVFEGFFDFLSFQTQLAADRILTPQSTKIPDSYIILNSLAFFRKNRELMEQYDDIHLFLDLDEAGLQAAAEARTWSAQYRDQSRLYDGFKDFNEFHIHSRD